jgi:hypothetical protein
MQPSHDDGSPYQPRAVPTAAEDPLLGQLASLTAQMDNEDEEILIPPAQHSHLNLHGEFSDQLVGEDDGLISEQVLKQKVSIISFTEAQLRAYCFGHVGTLKNAFCLKPKNACRYFYQGGIHATSCFPIKPDTYYICKPRPKDTAWCQFAIPEETLHEVHTESANPDTQLTVQEWKALFHIGLNRSVSSPQDTSKEQLRKEVKFYSIPPVISELKTPNKKLRVKSLQVKQEYENEFNKANKFLTLSEPENWSSDIPTELTTHVENMTQVLTLLLKQTEIIHSELEDRAQVSDVASDISNVLTTLQGLQSSIGLNPDNTFPDLWSGITEVAKTSKASELNDIELNIAGLLDEQKITTGHLKVHAARWKSLLSNWLPVVARHNLSLKTIQRSIVEMINDSSKSRSGLRTHGYKSDTLEAMLHSPPTEAIDLTATSELERHHRELIKSLEGRLASLERQYEELESKGGNGGEDQNDQEFAGNDRHEFGVSGVRYRNFYFKNEESVRKWLRKHLSLPCHGLFVDLVSFSEFFGGDRYVERNTTLNDLYLTNKIGYATMADSIVATSFQNVLPGAYGRRPDSTSNSGTSSSTSDLEAQAVLPGLASVDKWDKHDGGTGRKYWIQREARSTARQIDNMIRTQLSGPAQVLAKDLLNDSLSMSEAMFVFISNSYDDTMYSNRFDTHQAWTMTCKFVKRIFSELADVRVLARDGITIDDPWSTSAKFLFATLKAHVIMGDFMRLSIKDHPSISSEMVKFVCYSQPATDTAEVLGRLSNVESLQRGDQSSISRFEARLKKLETWKADTDKTVKKLVEKHGL